MNLVVCVKIVPKDLHCEMNPVTNTIMREKSEMIINPVDLNALEEAFQIRKKVGMGSVTVICMGPPSAKELLKHVICLGADRVILLSDKAFAGSDTYATSYILSRAIITIGNIDLVICGKQTTDGDTGQVGPSLGERLGFAHVTNIVDIDEVNQKHLVVIRSNEVNYDKVQVNLPALITVTKDINSPRKPTLIGLAKIDKIPITQWSAQDIHADINLCGLSGSPTRVVKVSSPNFQTTSELLKGSTQEQVVALIERLVQVEGFDILRKESIG